MKKKIFFLFIFVFLLLSACAKTSPASDGEGSISIYRILRPEYQTDGELLRVEKYPVPVGDSDPLLCAAYALKSMPSDERLMSSLQGELEIISVRASGGGAVVYLNEAYNALEGIDKTLVDYSIALTMSSLPDIDYVTLYVENESAGNLIRPENVLLYNTVNSPFEAQVRLYFPRPESGDIAFEYHSVTLSEDISPVRSVMDELLNGPENSRLSHALPDGTVLLSIYTQDGVCSVSLSGSFLDSCAESPEMARLWIYSVVNSLESLAEINSVQILIEGKAVSEAGGLDISTPLERTDKIVGSTLS